MTMIATRSAQGSWRCGGTVRTSPPAIAAAGPTSTASNPCRPGLVHILIAPIGCYRQHPDVLPPQRGLPSELTPLLLPGSIGVQGEDQSAVKRAVGQDTPSRRWNVFRARASRRA